MISETQSGTLSRISEKLVVIGATLCLSLFCLAWSAPAAYAVSEEHVFDPTLSLTGGCTTDEADPAPDPWCPGPPKPSAPFESPNITIDSYGDMYVSSHGPEGENGRIDVFSPQGQLITELAAEGARQLAVDEQGNLYVFEFVFGGVFQISRYTPTLYQPTAETIEYKPPGSVIVEEFTPEFGYISSWVGLAVDPSSGRVFISSSGHVGEWSSAVEGNELLDGTVGEGQLSTESKSLAVDAKRNRLFVTDSKGEPGTSFVQVLELKAPHKSLGIIDGAKTPNEQFLSDAGFLTVDADETTGHIFVSDLVGTNKVYEFGEGLSSQEEYLTTYQRKFKRVGPGEVAVDNASSSPNRGTLYVPSGGTVDHTFAFRFVAQRAPVVETISAAGITEDEAILQGTINPEGLATTYRFEYTTQKAFEESGFATSMTVKEGALAAGIVEERVSAAVSGLVPGTSYRFRLIATNEAGEDSGEAHFRTYEANPVVSSCPNQLLRIGFSSQLPDCRAYELVTPPDTNGRSPLGVGASGIYFPTLEASPDGNKTTFRIEGGSLPGSEGSGAFNGETYLATRGAGGWTTKIAAPSGTEAKAPLPGSVSPDQEYSFWGGESGGEIAASPYARYPDGHSELVGRGSLGTDPRVEAQLISEGATHILFATRNALGHPAIQLEENAPPEGTTAVYDRTADEVTHVISLLPGNITPAAGQNATYVGASYDGKGVAFEIGSSLYLRYNGEETYKVGENVTFAGVAEGGERIFYVAGGNLYSFDAKTQEPIPFSESGNVTVVTVSANGTTGYFISPSIITEKPNPNGELAQFGEDNLYLSREGDISFVATVKPSDVISAPLPNGEVYGLGTWIKALGLKRVGEETSRTTPDGNVLLFQSSAPLAGYDPEGHMEIYRYDSVAGVLSCVSCSSTEVPASSNASLQTIALTSTEAPVSTFARIPNLSPDGKRAFFESSEALVKADTDGVQDVYEWEEEGVGNCQKQGGCISLISSGQSARNNYLYSVSESGNDVFFLTSDILLGTDSDVTPSIYDARVNGGVPEAQAIACQGESCYPALTPSPILPTPATPVLGTSGDVRKRKCPKGKRKVIKKGRTHCVKKHPRHGHHAAGTKRRRVGR